MTNTSNDDRIIDDIDDPLGSPSILNNYLIARDRARRTVSAHNKYLDSLPFSFRSG